MSSAKHFFPTAAASVALSLAILLLPLVPSASAASQDPVTGAFAGQVTDVNSSRPIAAARVEITNVETGARYVRVSDSSGRFYQGALAPGNYRVVVTVQGYYRAELTQRLFATQVNTVVPLPVVLTPLPLTVTPTTPTDTTRTTPPTTTTTTPPATATTTTTPSPTATAPPPDTTAATSGGSRDDGEGVSVEDVNRTDGRRSGAFTEREVSTLPLGATTLVRTFDELALLLPGVTLPPYTFGNIAGPGVGAGVGSPGQFSSNGMPPRSNNFTVDGSDNNDEDIGVRRQGFLSLVPQPIESIKEYQVITLLAPAQFGRNIGAQVNAISRSGTNEFHGEFYGLFNSSQLNSRNFFDTDSDNAPAQLVAGNNQRVFVENFTATGNPLAGPLSFSPVAGTRRAFNVRNQAGGEDSFTLGQGGFVLGGPISPRKLFFFVSAERQILNASQEKSFAVPTLEQRGFDNSGATGLFQDRFALTPGSSAVRLGPQNLTGAAFLSLFPFPNNPSGVYGANTFTQVLPASGRGTVASGKIDYVNPSSRLLQSFTARYNFTDDERDIPAAGGAIFAALRPEVRTQNFSTFFNSELSGVGSSRPVYNQLRLSYGRTRLDFEELRDTSFLLGSQQSFGDSRFLLNAPVIQNITRGPSNGVANTGDVSLAQLVRPNGTPLTTEDVLGPIGQVSIAGFSPVGVDVFNFPQSRVNNTYQIADTLSIRSGPISYAFGVDIRRTELNSDLPRNARPLATFSGAPALQNNPLLGGLTNIDPARGIPFINPTTFAAAGLPTGFFQALTLGGNEDGNLGLRYYQLNFFGQEEIRVLPNLSLSLGVRYEYNTVPREQNDRLENAFQAISGNPQLDPGAVSFFIADRTRVFEPDRNNIAPRVGFAWAPQVFGPDHETVFRGGFGVYYDQILGSVVSQSRNIYPAFLPLNFSTINVGGTNTALTTVLPSQLTLSTTNTALAPAGPCIFVSAALTPACLSGGTPLLAGGTLNTFNPALSGAASQSAIINALSGTFPNSFGFTLPRRSLETPMAYHYSYSWEQRLSRSTVASLAYAGTTGRNLLRITTPFLGPNVFPVIGSVGATVAGPNSVAGPQISGIVSRPVRVNPAGPLGAIASRVGSFNVIETTGRSRYDSFQASLRGRYATRFQYQVAYTFSKAFDEVSDVFDVAGAAALPQNSLTLAGEYARSNFDVPHRLAYNFLWDIVPGASGFQLAGTGQFQSGQPFTVNSIIDVNTDGNLTDRLNSLDGVNVTDENRQRLTLSTTDTRGLLAPLGRDGAVRRNSFRAGNFALVNLTVIKKFGFTETQNLALRFDVFNLLNRENFGVPVRFLEAPGFGGATETVTPGRRLQIGLKYTF